MKITFLGVSSYLSEGFSSNVMVDGNYGTTLLIDCGEDIGASLKAAGRKVEDIDIVYISHLHGDHCGGLEWLAYYSYFITKKKIQLLIHESLVAELWSKLRPAMEKMAGEEMMTLDDYFYVLALKQSADGHWYNIDGVYYNLKKNEHVVGKTGIMYSYGLLAWSADREYFYISTDTSYSNPYKAGVNYNTLELEDNLLFQDCDVMNLSTGVHPNYDELKKLNPKTKKKMWLYHYTDLSKYDEFGDMPDAVADGFAGFVKEGQIFEL